MSKVPKFVRMYNDGLRSLTCTDAYAVLCCTFITFADSGQTNKPRILAIWGYVKYLLSHPQVAEHRYLELSFNLK
jgi:hypothetical protein